LFANAFVSNQIGELEVPYASRKPKQQWMELLRWTASPGQMVPPGVLAGWWVFPRQLELTGWR
jgi:hypothetical protein